MPLKHLFSLINPETKAKEGVKERLTDLLYRENLEDLVDQIDSISVGGGDGGDDSGTIGSIVQGGETDEAIYWKRKFHPLQHMLNGDSSNPSGFDPEGKSLKNELLQFIQNNDTGLTISADPNTYLGQLLVIAKSSQISFKIKKGINFFNVLTTNTTLSTDAVEVYIDGLTPTSLGLVDENGDAAPNSYSINTAAVFYQTAKSFYGLDGEEHIITLKNNDSAAKVFEIDAIEIGYRSENPTIDEAVHINAGKAVVRGAKTVFTEGLITFGTLEKNGHTGAIVLDKLGALSALDGESPAMTQCKPQEAIAFSGTITNLKVKNNNYFPANGICLLSTPYGNHHIFSYTDKLAATIQAHQLDGLIWSSQPTEDFTPCDNFDGGVGTATGDVSINYYGTAPIEIDSTNNKLDFKIIIAGVTTTHAATIATGRYAADLVPIEAAIRTAMQAAKSLNGEYHAKYNAESKLWNIYVDDEEVESMQLLFSSGVNVANSIHPTLGFGTSDFTLLKSYLGTTEVNSLCCRVFEAEKSFMHPEDPRIKYSTTNDTLSSTLRDDIQNRLGLGSIRALSSTSGFMQIFPDDDCSGLAVTFLYDNTGAMLTYQIDDGPCMYLQQIDNTHAVTSNVRANLNTAFISFAKGSRKITIRRESSDQFKLATGAGDYMYFVGARQYFTKPAFEKLTTNQSIIKTFEISPISLYATIYGHNAGTLYSPTGTDNLNTITEVGSFAAASVTSFFNHGCRQSTTNGDYVEVDFTLVGNGGGIAMKNHVGVGGAKKHGMFLSTSAIVEATDRICNVHPLWATAYWDTDTMGVLGLPAGTYKARFKNESGAAGPDFYNLGFVVTDTVAPEENKNTVTDISGIGQGIAYPINVIRGAIQQDSADRAPSWLERSGYKEGRVSKVNYSLNGPVWTNFDDASTLIVNATTYFGRYLRQAVIGDSNSVSGFFKSIAQKTPSGTSNTVTMQPFIDGTQILNIVSQRAQVKGGSAPSATRLSTSVIHAKLFELSCSHSAGLVFTIADTRGLKNNMTVVLDDGTNKEKAQLDSFVVGVSYTIKKALTTVIAANVTNIEFQGFHNYKVVSNDGGSNYTDCFEYEPLKISPSNALRRNRTMVYEKVSITHEYVATDDLYYPVHSDGVVGNWSTSTIERIKGDGLLYDLPQDLKNVTGTGTIKITSERLVPVLDERERF